MRTTIIHPFLCLHLCQKEVNLLRQLEILVKRNKIFCQNLYNDSYENNIILNIFLPVTSPSLFEMINIKYQELLASTKLVTKLISIKTGM